MLNAKLMWAFYIRGSWRTWNVLQKIILIVISKCHTLIYNASLEELRIVNLREYEWFLDLENNGKFWSKYQLGLLPIAFIYHDQYFKMSQCMGCKSNTQANNKFH